MMAAAMKTVSHPLQELADTADILTVIESVSRLFSQHGLFFGHGTANARDEAAWLVAAVMGWPQDWVGLVPSADQLARIRALAHRRVAERRPMAYLLGEGWLVGLKFYVDDRVLVPRSPLAELIENGLAPWVAAERVRRVLDLGTGSGCLAIALAHYLGDTLVDATDIDPGALHVARLNVSRHQMADRVRVLKSDLFGSLGPARYDVIVANPPYVPSTSMLGLPPEYAHEPSSALAAGLDGLDCVRRILTNARRHLNDGGALFLEVGEAAQALNDAYPRVPFTWLEFARGGEGVLVLTADQLSEYFAA
jgi:ribosomal protein L3 glutamine methyltransferase